MVSAGEVLQELVERAGDRKNFYRTRRHLGQERIISVGKAAGRAARAFRRKSADPDYGAGGETTEEMFDRLFPRQLKP